MLSTEDISLHNSAPMKLSLPTIQARCIFDDVMTYNLLTTQYFGLTRVLSHFQLIFPPGVTLSLSPPQAEFSFSSLTTDWGYPF